MKIGFGEMRKWLENPRERDNWKGKRTLERRTRDGQSERPLGGRARAVSYGGMARDEHGHVVFAFTRGGNVQSVLFQELKAVEIGISLCITQDYTKVVVASDSLRAIWILKEIEQPPWTCWNLRDQSAGATHLTNSHIKGILMEFDAIEDCTMECANDIKKYTTKVNSRRVYVFLASLDSHLDGVRGRVLAIKPLPDIQSVYAMVCAEVNY
ncbi:hypothetical protein IFM89_006632 [Coptis chinensis]|uniref:RNase H type-1 domain-containing protein n=1 Tax=Coptis chinensis TaxID=261450 RepID=A0A835HL40_9MAGN|nr:hypothetical protein IFM89_006632 [Coptis chinensis]